MPNNRPLESFTPAVLAEWVRVRGFSYFPEELQGIEDRMAKVWAPGDVVFAGQTIEAKRAPECATCKDQSIVISEGGKGIVLWCPAQCEGSRQLRSKAPEFVDDLNVCRATGASPKSRRKIGELKPASEIARVTGEVA